MALSLTTTSAPHWLMCTPTNPPPPSPVPSIQSIQTTATVTPVVGDARLHPRSTGFEPLRSYVVIRLAAATYADPMRRLKERGLSTSRWSDTIHRRL
jgi:hypothetical protein